jgi:hypothetical protein
MWLGNKIYTKVIEIQALGDQHEMKSEVKSWDTGKKLHFIGNVK